MMRDIWLFSKKVDLLVMGLPVWFCWAICFLLPEEIMNQSLPLWAWVIIVLGIDVSHVWSTIFRTYFDRDERENHSQLFKIAPLSAFVLCFAVAWYSSDLFWRILAYLALYHFIKQQYGFMQLYRGRYGRTEIKKIFSDKFVIYLSMIFPVIYWHINYDRAFSWFIEGDFISLNVDFIDNYLQTINIIGTSVYFGIIVYWLLEEVMIHRSNKLSYPLGKWIWVLTTAFNWYLGVIYFNSDIAFSITNVVAHGIPYFVLMYYYVLRKRVLSNGLSVPASGWKIIAIMITVVLLFAITEEYLWDMLLYVENHQFFEFFFDFPFAPVQSTLAQALVLALLSLPQVTHYILDGFIWKVNDKNPFIKPTLIN
ncbi:MAG: hypothetical protein JXR07_07065 [Reichenbachiella sp.]